MSQPRKGLFRLLTCACFIMGTGISPAIASDSLAGTWHGSLPLPGGMTLPLVFHFKKAGAGYEGTMDSPAQNISGTILTSPYFRHFISFDPAQIWAKVGCPVLALDGDRDMQVSADENLEAIKKALESGGNTNVTATKLPGLNHLFQSCQTGLPNEYAVIEETIAPQVLELISTWILQQTK